MRTSIFLTAAAFVFLSAAGPAQSAPGERQGQKARPGGATAAKAVLQAKSGSSVSGEVTIEEKEGGIRMRVDAKGVPQGLHGFHIHEKGDCSAPDATSAGGHFNPAKAPHAGPGAQRRHAGDLGNVLADDQGNVKHASLYSGFTLGRGPRSALGKAVVLHAKPDDLKSQPAGDAGGRIACGVIEPAASAPQTRK